jgi:hypothetical protein
VRGPLPAPIRSTGQDFFNPLDATGEYSRKAFNPLLCDGRDKSYCTLNAKYTLNFGF